LGKTKGQKMEWNGLPLPTEKRGERIGGRVDFRNNKGWKGTGGDAEAGVTAGRTKSCSGVGLRKSQRHKEGKATTTRRRKREKRKKRGIKITKNVVGPVQKGTATIGQRVNHGKLVFAVDVRTVKR